MAPQLMAAVVVLVAARCGEAISEKSVEEVLRCPQGTALGVVAHAVTPLVLPPPAPARRQRRFIKEQPPAPPALHEGLALIDDAESVTFDEAIVMDAGQGKPAFGDTSNASVAASSEQDSEERHVVLDAGWGARWSLPDEGDTTSAARRRDVALMELHLRNVSIEQLHAKANSSVAEFLGPLEAELSQVEGQRGRIRVIGVFGRYASRRWRLEEVARPVRVAEEVAVVFEASTSHAGVEQVIDSLRTRLLHLDLASPLRSPRFASVLEGFNITRHVPTKPKRHTTQELESIKAMRTMALPIFLSAVFTGLLLWLAS